MKTVTQMTLLLKSAVSGVLLSEEEKNNISAEQLQEMYAIAVKHDLAPMLSYTLMKNQLLDQESDIGKLFVQQQFIAVYRYEQMQSELGKICRVLEDAHIPFIPLKGAMIKQYYPEPWMRTSCDIDVLVQQEDLNKAVQCLCESLEYTYIGKDSHDVSLFSKNKVHLELHYDLVEEKYKDHISSVLSDVWTDATCAEGHSYHMLMSDEMFLLYHIAHMAKHVLYGGCGIRPFMDLWILKQVLSLNENRFETMLSQSDLTVFYAACNALNDVWLGGQEHSSLTMQMEHYLLYGGVYGSAENQLAVGRSKGESKLLHFFQLMFLSRENLAYIYPILTKYSALFPLYQVKRWFRIFRKKNRQVITGHIKVNHSLSAQKIETVSELLEQLQLN